MKATIKSKKEIEAISTYYNPGCGYHLKGQYFSEESLELSGQEFEFEQMHKNTDLVWQSKINGEWRFFSIEALHVITE